MQVRARIVRGYRHRGGGRTAAGVAGNLAPGRPGDCAPGPEDPAPGDPADQPAQVADPAHAGRPRYRHGQDVGVGQRHDQRGEYVDEVPVEDTPGQHVAEVTEDEPACPHGEL